MKGFTKNQKEDLKWFKKQLPHLLKKYRYRHVIIHKKEVQGNFEKFEDAVMFAIKDKKYKMGDFIVQEVVGRNDVVNFITAPVKQII